MSKRLNLKKCKKVPNRDEYVCAGTKVPGKVYRKAAKKSATPAPKPRPDKPKKPDEKKNTSTPGVYFSSILPSRGLGKATLDRLTDDQVLRARGIQGSKIYHRQGQEALEEHLQKYLPGYKLEKALDSAILVSKGKKGRIFVRGTAMENMKDWMDNIKLMLGGIRDLPFYKETKQLAADAKEKFDKVDISGYSRGAGASYGVGQELDIPSLSFNPLIGRKVISELGPQNIARNVARQFGLYGNPIDRSGRRIRTDHEIIRTTTDPASLLMGYSYLPANAKVDTIEANSDTLNPIRWHDLDAFYDNIPKGIRYRNKTDAELKKAIEKHRIIVKKLGEKITLDRMKKSIDEGKTLKEHMGDKMGEDKADLDGMGKFGNRPVKQYYDLWKKAGGKLSQIEADEIKARGGSIKKKDIDKSLDEKTRKFMDEYSRSSLKNDIKKSAAVLRRNKAKDGITSKNNEEKMLKQVEMSNIKDIKKLRTQFNEKIKPQLPKEENRLKFTAPSEIKRREQNARRKKGREIKKEVERLKSRAEERVSKLKEKTREEKAARAREKAEKKLKRLSRKRPTEKKTFKKAFGRKKLRERGFKKEAAENIEKRLMEGQNIKDSNALARKRFEREGLETKDEEPPPRDLENLGEETMGGILRNRTGGIESNISGPLTKDDEAREFLKKTSAAKKEQLDKETKMAESSAKEINEKVKDDFKGSSFKNSVKDAVFDNIKGLGPSILSAAAVNGLFKAIDPDGKFTDTPAGELSEGLGIGLATGGVLKGLGHFLEAGDWAELGVGGAVGQLASDEVGKLLYPALKKAGMSDVADSTLTSGVQGGVFAGTSLLTGTALRSGYSALSGALSSGIESGEGGTELTSAAVAGATETAETTAGAAVGSEVAEGGGVLASATAGAEAGGSSLSELGPPGILAGILGGFLVGSLFGLIDSPKPMSLMEYAQKGANSNQIEKLSKQTGASYEQTKAALQFEAGQLQDRIKQVLANKYGIHGPTTQIGLTAKQEKQITKQSPFTISEAALAEKAGLLPPEHPIPDRLPTIPVQTKK